MRASPDHEILYLVVVTRGSGERVMGRYARTESAWRRIVELRKDFLRSGDIVAVVRTDVAARRDRNATRKA